jgi:hypothetical protein
VKDKPVATVKIQVSESITGKFTARIDVESDGWSTPWYDFTVGADTPFEAIESAIAKAQYVTSGRKRGRRPIGWRSVLFLNRRSKKSEAV